MTVDENRIASGWISFDQVEIDLAGRRLFVDGNAMALEPKAFAVLVALAQQPGRAFTRDEILDAVWGHRHVTPGVLNRAVTLIRQALGETAEQTQYLHTVHGVGYRFDAPVRFSTRRAPAESTVATTPETAPASVAEIIQLAIPTAPAPMAGESVAVRADSTAESAAPVTATPGVRHWLRPMTFGLLALLAVVIYRFRLVEPSKPDAPAAPTLVMLPMHAIGDDKGESAFADGLSEELTTRLARIEGLRLISSISATRAQKDGLDPPQLAERLHVTHALEGSLRESGNQLRIGLRLIEVPSGRLVWSQNYDGTFIDIFAVQEQIAHAVATALLLNLGIGEDQVGSSDAATYREYLILRSALRDRYSADKTPLAVSRLRELTAHAPDFARAHALLARTLAEFIHLPGDPAEHIAEASRESARALQLNPNIAEGHAALAILACRRFDWTQCTDEFRNVLRSNPDDSRVRIGYAVWLARIGYIGEALDEAKRALQWDRLSIDANFTLSRLLDTVGKHEESRQYLDNATTLQTSGGYSLAYAGWFNAVWRHDFSAASGFAAQTPVADGFRDSYLAVSRALSDPAKWPQANVSIAASELAGGRYNFLRLLMPQADDARAVAGFEAALSHGGSSYDFLLWMHEYAFVRRGAAFQDFLKRTRILDYWRAHGFPPQCMPDGDGALCD